MKSIKSIYKIGLGPSSSHTAGAASIARLAWRMLRNEVKSVHFTLYGSFARTYQGHGTDRALLGGMMGFETDDVRIRDSFEIAQKCGFSDNGFFAKVFLKEVGITPSAFRAECKKQA